MSYKVYRKKGVQMLEHKQKSETPAEGNKPEYACDSHAVSHRSGRERGDKEEIHQRSAKGVTYGQ
jgi:hypothetical protein